jgi:hypothetical protein
MKKDDGLGVFPCALLLFCMGNAEMHSRAQSPLPAKAIAAVQTSLSDLAVEGGFECWVGEKLVNAFEFIGQADSVMDLYNSFVTGFVRGASGKALRYRARCLFDAKSISKYKVFYVLPLLLVAKAGEQGRILPGMRLSDAATKQIEETLLKTYRVGNEPFSVVPEVMHRSRVAAAMENNFTQTIVAQLGRDLRSAKDLPGPVEPFFKLSSEWPMMLPVPEFNSEADLESRVKLPGKLETPDTVQVLKAKGWTVEES